MEKLTVKASLTKGEGHYQYLYANNAYIASVWGEVQSVIAYPDRNLTQVTIGICDATFWVNKVEWVNNDVGVQTTIKQPETATV